MMDDIPFTYVGIKILYSLANKLDPDTGLNGNNWRMLADKLGYSTEEILCLECKKTSHGRNTVTLFEEYMKKKNSTVQKLLDCLDSMDRPDALQVLLDAMPEIQKSYEADKKRIKVEAQEHDEYNYCNYSQRMPDYYSRSMSKHGYHPTVAYQPPISAHPSCNAQRMNICATNTFNNLEPEMCMPPNNMTRTRRQTQLKEINTIHNYPRMQHPGMSVASNTRCSAALSSMAGTHPQSMALCMERNDYYPSQEVEMTDVSSRDSSHSVGRYHKDYLLPLNRVPPLVNPNEMSVGREEEVSDSTYMEAKSFPTQRHHRILQRQNSEESNARQPLVEPNLENGRNSVADKKLGLIISGNHTRNGLSYDGQDDFLSPSPTPTQTPNGGNTPMNPLDKLRQITGSDSYMPDEKYKSMIEEKNREEILYNTSRCGVEDTHKKLRLDSTSKENSFDWFCFDKSHPQSRSGSQGSNLPGKPGVPSKDQIPKTFPRAKSMTTYLSNESSQERPSILSKSQSMPNDMKPAEYRKAFQHIRVFVTYAADSNHHIRRVLNLCKCLEKNGFTCCVDMYDRRMPTEDKLGWVEQRFQEADFILVCVSQEYKNEEEMSEMDNSIDVSSNQLHTRYIYKLMKEEYTQQNKNKRFIPVILEGADDDHVPIWLQNTLHYKWPAHFRDLLWFLTKPETRIKSKSRSLSDYSSSPSPQSPQSPGRSQPFCA